GVGADLSAGKQKLIAFAKSALGTPYLWGGAGPGGFDCSGLVMWAFANGLNVDLPHSTYEQVKMGQQVMPTAAKPGDVVFTNYGEGGKAGPGHEGLIVGVDKNGQPIIEAAPHTGANVQTYQGYQAFTGGAYYTVRDLTAKATATTDTTTSDTTKKKYKFDATSKGTPSAIPADVQSAIDKAANEASNAFRT